MVAAAARSASVVFILGWLAVASPERGRAYAWVLGSAAFFLVTGLTQLWLYLTPVMYPLERVPDGLRPLYLANPMTGLVEAFREVLAYGRAPTFSLLVPAAIGAVLVLAAGISYFSVTESRFADVI